MFRAYSMAHELMEGMNGKRGGKERDQIYRRPEGLNEAKAFLELTSLKTLYARVSTCVIAIRKYILDDLSSSYSVAPVGQFEVPQTNLKTKG